MMTSHKIWSNNFNKDTYIDFLGHFSCNEDKNVILKLSSDTIASVWINGVLACFGEFYDYPSLDEYKEYDITKFCKKDNEIKFTVWYFGENSQTYIVDKPYLMFNIIQDNKVLLCSDSNILCRENPNYKSGYCKNITMQLGYSFLYDSTSTKDNIYNKSIVQGKGKASKCKIKNLVLLDRTTPYISIDKDVYTIDMKSEMAGFLELDFVSKNPQKLVISFGEHLIDGKVRRIIGERDFSVEYIAKKGENKYINTFRRLGCRYLQFKARDIEVNYIGIRQTIYPITIKPNPFKNPLIKQIYDVSVKTLHNCMHSHYEDTPWREQALYNMDSRNEMLCSYYAFKETDFIRENLVLMSKGLRKDGLLSICFPSGVDIPIPSFNLAYPIQVCEYIEYTKDYSILDEVGDCLKTVINTFLSKIDETNLVSNFPYPYWNFYEWTDYSNNFEEIERTSKDKYIKSYDLILNCLLVYSLSFYNSIFNIKIDTSLIKKAIHNTFYDTKKGIYKLSSIGESHYSQLGNSLAILIGLGDNELAKKIIEGKDMVKISLSMNIFMYDALLQIDNIYSEYILDRIITTYKKMLDCGATSFWETEKGEADFDGAGSLCHGWSALPIYYFNKFIKKETKDEDN